jgi:hypothetical protein
LTDPSPFRILVFDLPPLLRDMLMRALDANEDMASVAASAGGLEQAVADERPDAIIALMKDDELEPESRRLLEERARFSVLGIQLRKGSAVLFQLGPHRSHLGTIVPDELAPLIRTALARKVGV